VSGRAEFSGSHRHSYLGRAAPTTDDRPTKGFMSAELNSNRDQARIIRRYLEVMQSNGSREIQTRTPNTVRQELQEVRHQIVLGDARLRPKLARKRIRLEAELRTLSETDCRELWDLEEEFVACAAAYSAHNGLTYRAWRSAGVKPDVLRRAGISAGTP
jgi:hypothetical protein